MIFHCKLYEFQNSYPSEETIEAESEHEAMDKLLNVHGFTSLEQVDRLSIQIKH